MTGVLAQERLLGAALGSILTGVVIFEQRKSIYESISQTQSQERRGWDENFKIKGREGS
ncbi:uncharacterized protein LOC111369934 [Olea europaea subsp. europaea]|uniref:Uncharacterized protein LOC111369934 n=1 Tax=Olea europaea subsp. europaea TaxID=158383 RepID=A0A8S0SYH6_OLEEU|nr:uncharacterized protein LOC111369934 [Olea europaea subsp. europaea]